MSSETSARGFGVTAVETAVGMSDRQNRMPVAMNRLAVVTSPVATTICPPMIAA
jgi:hypothetical protein